VDERDWLQLSATQIRRRKTSPSASGLASHTLLSEAGVLGAVLLASSSRKAKGHIILTAVEMIRDNDEELTTVSGIAVPDELRVQRTSAAPGGAASTKYRKRRWIASE